MLSLYIHIPFCEKKCKYCSFNVIPCEWIDEVDSMIDKYVEVVCQEIKKIWTTNNWENGIKKLRSLYFWWWTPSKIWFINLEKIIDCVWEYFDLENLWELSIELNPYPADSVLNIIESIQKKYNKFPRIRRSIGIQTFDSEILKASGRMYSFPAMVDFLRRLQPLKQANTILNFDFIAFWKFNQSKTGNTYLWDQQKLDFFEEFVNSEFADWFSLYTLELFSGSDWYSMSKLWDNISNESQKTCDNLKQTNSDFFGSDDDIYEEFSLLKDILLDAWYLRYELSNFAKSGKSSIHNRVYRNMENYIGIWTSASSFLKHNEIWKYFDDVDFTWHDFNKVKAIRHTNTIMFWDYIKWKSIDKSKTEYLSEKDYLIEKFFLSLRTDEWINNLSEFESVMEKDWDSKILKFQWQELLEYDGKRLVLSDQGMDVFNAIITELLVM